MGAWTIVKLGNTRKKFLNPRFELATFKMQGVNCTSAASICYLLSISTFGWIPSDPFRPEPEASSRDFNLKWSHNLNVSIQKKEKKGFKINSPF